MDDIRAIVAEAPLFTPQMPKTGKEMSVRMTNCGALGWVTDKERGYRYQAAHPVTESRGRQCRRRSWRSLGRAFGLPHPAEACLVNFYSAEAKMGLHQDRDETDFAAPVLSVSLGRRLPIPGRRREA